MLCSMAGRLADAATFAAGTDPFFSRRAIRPSNRHARACIQAKDITALLKEIAVVAGLDPKGFTAKSLKYAHVTSNQMAGLSRTQSAQVTGHTSETSHDHYLAGLMSRQVGTLTAAQVPGPANAILSTRDAIRNQSRFSTVIHQGPSSSVSDSEANHHTAPPTAVSTTNTDTPDHRDARRYSAIPGNSDAVPLAEGPTTRRRQRAAYQQANASRRVTRRTTRTQA